MRAVDINSKSARHLFLFAFKYSYSKDTNTPPHQITPHPHVDKGRKERGGRVGVSPLNFHIALVTRHPPRQKDHPDAKKEQDETENNSTIQQLAKINKGIKKQKTTRLVYARTPPPARFACLPACLPLFPRSRVIYHTHTHHTHPRPNRIPFCHHPFHLSITHHHRCRHHLPTPMPPSLPTPIPPETQECALLTPISSSIGKEKKAVLMLPWN